MRCEPCIRLYMHKAVELGATREEIGEMLAVASAMGGCMGETWAAKAFAAVSSDLPDPPLLRKLSLHGQSVQRSGCVSA